MLAAREEQFRKAKKLVCEILELDESEVTEDGLFNEDYGADSLRSIEILAALEKELGIVIDQSELSRMVNLRGLNEVVAEASGWN